MSTSLKRLSHIFLFLICLGPTLNLFSQEERIQQEFMAYFDLIKQQKIDEAMDYLPKDFFELVSREDMVAAVEQLFSNPEMEFRFGDTEVSEVSKPALVEGKWYATLYHSNVMMMKMPIPEDYSSSEEDKKLYRDIMVKALEGEFGKGNASYDPSSKFFIINSNKLAVAISSNGQSDWKFIVAENGQLPLLKKFLPTEVMTNLLTELEK